MTIISADGESTHRPWFTDFGLLWCRRCPTLGHVILISSPFVPSFFRLLCSNTSPSDLILLNINLVLNSYLSRWVSSSTREMLNSVPLSSKSYASNSAEWSMLNSLAYRAFISSSRYSIGIGVLLCERIIPKGGSQAFGIASAVIQVQFHIVILSEITNGAISPPTLCLPARMRM